MNYLKSQFEGFFFFYRHIGSRIFLALALSLLVGVLDGFGLTMFLPLLQVVDSGGTIDSAELGGLKFLVLAIEYFNIHLTLFNVLLFIVIFFSLKAVISFVQYNYRIFLQEYFIRKIRLSHIEGLNEISYKAFLDSDSGRIQNILTGEVDRVSRAYQGYFQGVQCIIMVLVYIVFAFLVNAQFALLVTVGGLLTNLIYKRIYNSTKSVSRALTLDSNYFQGLIIQYVQNYKYMKATGALSKYSGMLKTTVQKIEANNKRIGKLMGILISTREPLVIAVVSLVIYIQTGILGAALGPIMISLLFFYRALSFLMQAQSHLNFYYSVVGSLKNVDDFSTQLHTRKQMTGTVQLSRFNRGLQVTNGVVKFKEKTTLNNISLSVSKNETIALVGESGSGKTTLINVLSGLLQLDSGSYLVDGIDVAQLDMESFQKRIGYITQDPVIFNDTVYNNVTLWAERTPTNVSRFHEALRRAAATVFVEKLEKKEETILGHSGMNLSGGQKQRISIARELFKDVDILILDEATSSLDSQTEKEIQESIDYLKGQYTLLIVAHRLSTVKSADRVILMSEGKIESIDTFKGLVQTSEKFNQMIKLQELT